MNLFLNPRKKIQNILTKIGRGRVSEADIKSFMELLGTDPSILSEVIDVLADILNRDNTKAYNSAIKVLNMIAETEPEKVARSLDAIMGCIRRGEKKIPEDWIPGALDILLKISQEYPERMYSAIPDLFMCLENNSATTREKSYLLLAFLVLRRTILFNGHSKELIRALNGLYIDERIYACRLIKKIAEADPAIVESTFEVLDDLRLNHPDCNLRSEAAYAVDKFKIKKNKIKQKPGGSVETNKKRSGKRKKIKAGYRAIDMPEDSINYFSELSSLYEIELREILKGWGFNHLIRKK